MGRLDVLAPVPYGDEEVRLAAMPAELSPPPAWLITVINLAVTPETETHGDWLRGLRTLVDNRTLTRVLLLADDTAYRAVLDGADADRRLAERLAAWQSLAEVHGLAVVPIGEGRASAAKLARRVRRHAYPPVPAG